MQTRTLSSSDQAILEELLLLEPAHNLFHLSGLIETGLEAAERHGGSWAIGAFRGSQLVGAVAGLRGTGGIYHTPGDDEALSLLARAVEAKGQRGLLSLLSGHSLQLDPLLDVVGGIDLNQMDRCHFTTLHSACLESSSPDGYGEPRIGTDADIERLIDFYDVGFYSLARLPSRQAWRSRLTEQVAFRTLFLIEDNAGRVVSAVLSSAEAGGCAMLGGVATLHAHRGRGLSTACVGALCNYLFGKGLNSISLFYLKDNVSAGRLYEKLGFKEDGEWLLAPIGMGAAFAPIMRGM